MPLPVKLSDALVLDARLAAEVEQRSIAGQVEYWASLGKLVDALLDGQNRTEVLQKSKSKSLSELVATVGTPEGDARLKAYLESEPFPHLEPHPTRKGILIRTEADGSRSVGRFVDRMFVAESSKKERHAPHARMGNRFTPVSSRARSVLIGLIKSRNSDAPMESKHRLTPTTGANHVTKVRHDRQAASGALPKQLLGKNSRAVGIRTK
jgi:hypothetical protein